MNNSDKVPRNLYVGIIWDILKTSTTTFRETFFVRKILQLSLYISVQNFFFILIYKVMFIQWRECHVVRSLNWFPCFKFYQACYWVNFFHDFFSKPKFSTLDYIWLHKKIGLDATEYASEMQWTAGYLVVSNVNMQEGARWVLNISIHAILHEP